ncbi:MAG: F0F1 ATP synthase subunit epsilon [Paludibacter sp.]|nr:F0F1 ATP synthase subunit epsilon [Paludibacter sp.]
MKLEIITPNQIYFSGEVSSITLPGSSGMFTLWENHAPLISILTLGKMKYISEGVINELEIQGGFMEVNKNIVSVCLES